MANLNVGGVNIPDAVAPSQVRNSTVPDDSANIKTNDKNTFRNRVEDVLSKTKEELKLDVKEEKVFSSVDEPNILGTIIVTLYENRPYDVEFSGKINGNERELACKFIRNRYSEWKKKLSKTQGKSKEEEKNA